MLDDLELTADEVGDLLNVSVSEATVSNARSTAKIIQAWQKYPGATTPEIKRMTGVDTERNVKAARKYLKLD